MKRLSSGEFAAIKRITDLDVSAPLAVKITGRSYHLVRQVQASPDFPHYLKAIKEHNLERKNGKAAPTSPAKPEVAQLPPDKTVTSQLNSILALLKAIEYKLDR